jgi:CheY-like chemotaxis protein
MDKVLRIVHLEDSDNDAVLIRRRLAEGGLQCAVSRVETREAFQAAVEQGECDVILADYTLPTFDGLSALAMAKEKRPDLPFIFVSGTIGEERSLETLQQGAVDYVFKDRLDKLAPAVRRALGMGREREERRRAEQALVQRVEMEKCIAAIATKLMVLSPAECAAGISSALQQLGEFSGIERICLFLMDDSGKTASAAHAWSSPGAGPRTGKGPDTPVGEFCWCLERLRKFEVVRVRCAADLPEEAAAERRFFAELGAASLLLVPMAFGGKLAGFLCFESFRADKTWSDEDVKMLGIVSDILVNVMERKRSEEKLRMRLDELERFRSATVQREFRIKELKERVKGLECEVQRLKA